MQARHIRGDLRDGRIERGKIIDKRRRGDGEEVSVLQRGRTGRNGRTLLLDRAQMVACKRATATRATTRFSVPGTKTWSMGKVTETEINCHPPEAEEHCSQLDPLNGSFLLL